MLRILYVHGFEGSGNGNSSKLLKKIISEILQTDIKLIAPQFENNLLKFKDNINKIKIYSNNVDIIISSSFGALETLVADIKIPRILINPALLPYTELSKIGLINNDFLYYKKLENIITKYLKNKNIWYIISRNDTVIGPDNVGKHIQLINKFGNSENLNIIDSNKHKVTTDIAKCVGDIILGYYVSKLNESEQYYCDYNSIVYNDTDIKNLYESTIYCVSRKQKQKYIDILIPLIKESYNNIGGFAGDIETELLDNLVFFRVEINNAKEPLVVQAYKGNKAFRKAFLVATNKNIPESKNAFKKLINDNLKNIKNYGWYAEVSEAPEHIFVDKFKYPLVPNTQVAKYFKIMKPDLTLELHPDGYHYTRIINGKKYQKVMVGIDPYTYLKSKRIKIY